MTTGTLSVSPRKKALGCVGMRPRDTSEQAYAAQLESFRSLSPAQRAERGVALCEFTREVCRAGIRHPHPEYSPADVEAALM